MTRDPLQIEFICPVPAEQQPCNEYTDLKESFFFGWPQLPLGKYIQKLISLSLWSSFLAGPIAAALFHPGKDIARFLLAGFFGVLISLALANLRLYLGWSYVRERLKAKKVFYEESGWYDGQVWQKPEAFLSRDLLIVHYQIEPIMQRLRKTAVVLLSIIITSSLAWYVLAQLP